jgi:hypothetical protein
MDKWATPQHNRNTYDLNSQQEDETLLYEGMLKRGMRLIPILALLTNEASSKGHNCAGCRTSIPYQAERVTTRILATKRPTDHSDHHHWHRDCFEHSAQKSNNEHALRKWSIATYALDQQIIESELIAG